MQAINSILPAIQIKLDKLREWEEDVKAEYKGPTQDQIRDGMIASQVGNIFAAQLQRDESVKKEDDQRGYVRDAIETGNAVVYGQQNIR